MGWLTMQSLGGFSGPRQYLDDQFTYQRDGLRSTVLRSALVRMRTYYAAVEHIHPSRERAVFAAVCLVHYNRRDREGAIFGYKDMDESMGPCEAECPATLLDLLTPTTNEHALAWRERCRTFIARRAARPRLRNGWILEFDQPVTFSDGASYTRLVVAIDPRRPRRVRFRPPGGHGLYRIGNLDVHPFTVERSS